MHTSRGINDYVKETYTQLPVARGVGALFGLEIMAKDMMHCLNEGLRMSGYSDEIRYFFDIHVKIEQQHGEESFSSAIPLFESGTEDEIASRKKEFEIGLQEFMVCLEKFWSGIQQHCQS